MPTVIPPALGHLRYALRECEASLRRAFGFEPVAAKVYAIRCPHCGVWVKPRRFDLRHMSCRTCLSTLARPARGDGFWCL